MLVLYLDESRDHSLDKIDQLFPMFALAGCAFEPAYHDIEATKFMDTYKIRLFGRTDIILHTADITRNKNGFEGLQDRRFREEFYRETKELVESLSFTIIAAALNKDAHLAKNSVPDHPYDLCPESIVESFDLMLEASDTVGTIVAEGRNALFDQQLFDTFRRTVDHRTDQMRGGSTRARIRDLAFRAKADNLAGLQIADLVVTPIARHCMGKRNHKDFETIERKFLQGPSGYSGCGLKRLA